MEETIQVFDFHRIFLGDDPPLFMVEIVLRTLIMYVYTIILLKILGKRGMGQLSMLELAIIISFGSAVGDPMVGADMPILHGIVAVTAVTIIQIGIEKLINHSKIAEERLEGHPTLVVYKGEIQKENVIKNNLSKEDLLRLLRTKDLKHLGQIERAYFETSGQISVMQFEKDKVQPGLTLVPEREVADNIVRNAKVLEEGFYSCLDCGYTAWLASDRECGHCDKCHSHKWLPSTDTTQ